MPDIWTHYPEIVRDLLREAGFTCGVEPRILKGRDPDWTCIVDGNRIAGDIYIHQAGTTVSTGMAALVFGLLGVLLLVAVSEAWVIIRLRRGAVRPRRESRASRLRRLDARHEPPDPVAGSGRRHLRCQLLL
jgi:hypothetical protein